MTSNSNNFGIDFILYLINTKQILNTDDVSTNTNLFNTNLFLVNIYTDNNILILKERGLDKDNIYGWDFSESSDFNPYSYVMEFTTFFLYLEKITKNDETIIQLQVKDIMSKVDGIPVITANNNSLNIYLDGKGNYTISDIQILKIANSTVKDTYLKDFLSSSSGFDYLKNCCGVGQTTNSCLPYCGVIGYFTKYGMPSDMCDSIFEDGCSKTDADDNWSSVCKCYVAPDDPVYNVYKDSDLNIPNICFNSSCRDPTTSYIKSTDRNVRCPDLCTGIIQQNVSEYGVLDNKNLTVNLECGKTSVVIPTPTTSKKTNQTKTMTKNKGKNKHKGKNKGKSKNKSAVSNMIIFTFFFIFLILVFVFLINTNK